MANNDYITTDCKLTVSKNTAKLDEEIFLYKNDRNIKLLIEIVDNKYRYKSDDLSNLLVKYKASYAQVKWYKNAEVKKEFPIQATDDGKVVFVIEGQLIDEDTELGDYDLQLRLLNESQESIRSLPIIKGAVHILKPLFEEGDIATVNSAVADVSMLSLDGDAIDTYNSDGTYNQTNWGNGDVISSAKLNKLEKVAKDNVDKVNKIPTKSIVEGGKIYLAKEDGTKLDSGTELPAGGTGTSYDDTEIKSDINTIKTDLGTEELTTTAKNVKGAVNEVAAQYKDIVNLSLTKHTDGKVYIKKQDGTLLGDGIEIGGSGVDLSKITMSMDNQTLKLMNDGEQIATVDIPTATVTDEQITTAVNSYLQNNPISNKQFSKLYNKKWAVIGDSLTAGDKTSKIYAEYIQDKTGCNIVKMGQPGTGYSKDWNSYVKFYDRLTTIPPDVDLITIFGGVNDFNRSPSTTLGILGDNDFTTFYGAVETTISRVIELFPYVPLVIISPLPMSTQLDVNTTFKKYVNAIKEVANKYGVLFIDLYNESGFQVYNATFRAKFITDGIHPNENGHKRLANRILPYLEKAIDDSTIGNDTISCTNIILNNNTLTFTDIASQTLTATVTPSDTTDIVVWSINPTGIATVNNGVVTPTKNGNCVVTATCGTKTATCNITVTGIATRYTVTNNLSNCTNSNNATTIEENSTYSATITANEGCKLENVTVSMGGTDVTSTVYNNGIINISSVTGDIVITANAIQSSSILENFVSAATSDFENILGVANTSQVDSDGVFSCTNGSETLNGGFNIFKVNKNIDGLSFEWTKDSKYLNIGLYKDNDNKVYCVQPMAAKASIIWNLNDKSYINPNGTWGNKGITASSGEVITYIYENNTLKTYIGEELKTIITDEEAKTLLSSDSIYNYFSIALSEAFKLKNVKYRLKIK